MVSDLLKEKNISDFGPTWFDISLQHLCKHKTLLLLCEKHQNVKFSGVRNDSLVFSLRTIYFAVISLGSENVFQAWESCTFLKPQGNMKPFDLKGRVTSKITQFPIYPHADKVSFICSGFDMSTAEISAATALQKMWMECCLFLLKHQEMTF